MEPPGFPDWPITAFVERLAAGTPMPGGGCAVALAGALTAALGSPAIQITRQRDLAPGERHRVLLDKIREQHSAFLVFLDAEALAYHEGVKARRRPRQTPAEHQARSQAVAAFLRACDPPLAMAARGLELLHWAGQLADNGQPVTLADVGVMGFLATAVVHGALINIFSNLSMVPDTPEKDPIRERARRIKQQVDRLSPRVQALLYQQVGEPEENFLNFPKPS